MTFRLGIISDTHGHLHRDVFTHFKGVDAIVHGGDVVSDSIISELESIAPTYPVLGNCDPDDGILPEEQHLDFPCGRVIVLHSHLIADSDRNANGMGRLFSAENPVLIVYGHTHLQHVQKVGGTWVVNPGPSGKARLQDVPSLMVASWHESLKGWEIESHLLDWRS